MTGDLLHVADLTVATPDRKALLDTVSLALKPGEIVGLTGPSGAGKSVLAWALLGLSKPNLTLSGTVTLEGADLLALPPDEARRKRGRDIALIVQNPRAALHPMLPVGHQISRIWQAHHRGSSDLGRERSIEMLKLVGINDPERRAQAFAHELSGGMAQRVLIAAALAASPRVLVADEPTSGLDVTVQTAFLDMMAAAARSQGTAMLLVTQEPGILANYCDRVISMDRGRVLRDEPTAAHFAGHSDARVVGPAPIDAPVVVEARHLTKTFPVRGTRSVVHAVQAIDLTIRQGETLGLVGESGSGKTTAGRSLIRLLQPDSGEICIGGAEVHRLAPKALRSLRRRVQLVRQDPFDSFDPRWTLLRSVEEPLRQHGFTDTATRAMDMLRLVGCADLAGRKPGACSAGALQRVAIARALAPEPSFVVLDEPTSVLAPHDRAELVGLLQDLQKRTNVAFLFISHDLTTVAAISHRVSVMYLGQVVESGPVQEVFGCPRHPYTRALISAHLGVDPHRRRVDFPPAETLQGEIPSPIDLPNGCFLASRCPFVLPRCQEERQPMIRRGASEFRCWRADLGEIPSISGRTT